jgi:ubiquitin-like 1-activating enzyme E1 A
VLILDLFQARSNGKRRPTTSEADLKVLGLIRDEVCKDRCVDPAMVPNDVLASYAAGSAGELGPVSAIVGGILAGELIKTISEKDKPHTNFLFFEGPTIEGRVVLLGGAK